jgi:hypothetical protein
MRFFLLLISKFDSPDGRLPYLPAALKQAIEIIH